MIRGIIFILFGVGLVGCGLRDIKNRNQTEAKPEAQPEAQPVDDQHKLPLDLPA